MIYMVKGEPLTARTRVRVKNPDGSYTNLDVTGWSFTFKIKKHETDTAVIAQKTVVANSQNGQQGLGTAEFTITDLQSLNVGIYYMFVNAIPAPGSIHKSTGEYLEVKQGA